MLCDVMVTQYPIIIIPCYSLLFYHDCASEEYTINSKKINSKKSNTAIKNGVAYVEKYY